LLGIELSLVAHAEELCFEKERRLAIGSGGLNELLMVLDIHHQLYEVDGENIASVRVILSPGLVH
jgi:hypothetical protein